MSDPTIGDVPVAPAEQSTVELVNDAPVERADNVSASQTANGSVKRADDVKQTDDVTQTDDVQESTAEANEHGVPSGTMDAYSYTKFDEFTSEIFKIEIQNLPRYSTPAELKKLLRNKFSLEAKKLKVIKGVGHKPTFGFVTFCNDADRDRAIESLNNFVLKKHTLKVTKAKPSKDPALDKKNQRDANDEAAV